MKLAQVVDRIRGPEGTEVVLTVRQPKAKEARTLKMARGTLFLPTVLGLRKQSSGDWDLKLGGPDKIAYLRIQDITASTPHELRKLAAELESEGFQGADPRSAPSVASVASIRRFSWRTACSTTGTIGRVRKADRVMTYEATPDALFRGRPIAVLVDRETMCGAEWLAAALQDNHRATIVGTPTASLYPGRALVRAR